MLVVLGGLPGTGKTTIARALAERLGAAHIRIDAIETAMWRVGIDRDQPTGIGSYAVAEAIAESCLRVGVPVVVDAVNPVEAARRAWRHLADRAEVPLRVVEVVCPDEDEHRRRLESREADLEGACMPTWADVESREYDAWAEPRLVLDSREPLDASIDAVESYVRNGRG
jgi:predicted kinase